MCQLSQSIHEQRSLGTQYIENKNSIREESRKPKIRLRQDETTNRTTKE